MRQHPEIDRIAEIEALAGAADVEPRGKLHACVVCGRELRRGERRVHRGQCARDRKTQLQRKRRGYGR